MKEKRCDLVNAKTEEWKKEGEIDRWKKFLKRTCHVKVTLKPIPYISV